MMKMRKVSWFVCLLVTLSFSIFYLSIKAPAAETEAALVEGAKKEGKLLIYSTVSGLQEYEQRIKAFKQKYPFIDVETRRDIGGSLLLRVLAEAKANRHEVDLIDIRGFKIDVLKKQGLLMKYSAPNFRYIAPEFIDPDGYYWAYNYVVQSISYNTNFVSPQEAPKTWNDLLNPKWKGKLCMSDMDHEWYANMLAFMGKEKGMEFMKELSKQDIQFRAGKRLLANLIIAGEFHIFLTSSGHTIESLRLNGAPIKWVPLNPIQAMVGAMGIASHAPHPNAAKLHENFISSKEGQEVVSMTSGANPIRADAKHKYPGLDLKSRGYKLIFSSLTTDYYTEFDKEFRGLFMKRLR